MNNELLDQMAAKLKATISEAYFLGWNDCLIHIRDAVQQNVIAAPSIRNFPRSKYGSVKQAIYDTLLSGGECGVDNAVLFQKGFKPSSVRSALGNLTTRGEIECRKGRWFLRIDPPPITPEEK